MRSLTFVVPGPPRGAQRHRVGQGRRMYHTAEHMQAEAQITALACVAQAKSGGLRRWMLDGPVQLTLTAWFRRPERLRRKKDRGNELLRYTGKPDADNLSKVYMDALTKAGVWTDDTMVAELIVRRWYLPLDAAGQDVGDERVEVDIAG